VVVAKHQALDTLQFFKALLLFGLSTSDNHRWLPALHWPPALKRRRTSGISSSRLNGAGSFLQKQDFFFDGRKNKNSRKINEDS